MKLVTIFLGVVMVMVFVVVGSNLSNTRSAWMTILGSIMNNSNRGNYTEEKAAIFEILNSADGEKILKQWGIEPFFARAVVENTNLTVLFTKTINTGAFVKILAAEDKMRAFIDSVDWCFLDQTIDIESLLKSSNVSDYIGKSLEIDPNLVKAVINHTDIDWLYKGADVEKIVEILIFSNETTKEKNVKLLRALDMDEIVESVRWKELLEDENFIGALGNQSDTNKMTLQLIKWIGMENFLKAIDLKSVLIYAASNGSLMNAEEILGFVNWERFAQIALNTNDTLTISSECRQAFKEMTFPLPDFSNVDFSRVESLLMLKHPMLQLLDSWNKLPSRILMGKSFWLGAVDQCNAIKNAKYCVANMDIAGDMIKGSYGFCLPKTCSESDGLKILEYIGKNVLQDFVKFPGREKPPISVNPVRCTKELPYDQGFIITMAIISIILLFVVIGTIVDEVSNLCHKQDSSNEEKTEINKKKPQHRSLLAKIFICFSFTRNTKTILSTKVPKGAIVSINGIRTISLTWIIVGHTFAIMKRSPLDNLLHLRDLIYEHATLVVTNAYPCVDTFFILSGLLVGYLSLKKMDKTGGKLNVLLFYLHRFLRVTPVYMLILLLRTNVFTAFYERHDMGLYRDETKTRKVCQRYWWTNFLYINNFFPKSFWASCFSISWYLAVDMQFYIVSPLFLYSIYYLEKRLSKTRLRFYSGAIVVTLGCFVCFLINAILIVYNDYPTVHAAYQLKMKGNPRANPRMDPQDELYDKPYTRITPYLIGILVGYMFSRNLKMECKLKKLINVIFWIAALVMGYYIIYGPSQMYKKNPVFFTDDENTAFGSLHILGWSIAVGWVIYACHYGMGGVVNDFLSWKAWIPLSRLTFCAYLLHYDVAYHFLFASHIGYHLQRTAFVFHFISITVTTFTLSFVVSTCAEVPLSNLEKLIFK